MKEKKVEKLQVDKPQKTPVGRERTQDLKDRAAMFKQDPKWHKKPEHSKWVKRGVPKVESIMSDYEYELIGESIWDTYQSMAYLLMEASSGRKHHAYDMERWEANEKLVDAAEKREAAELAAAKREGRSAKYNARPGRMAKPRSAPGGPGGVGSREDIHKK